MGKSVSSFLAFNRGEIDAATLTRIDIDRMRLAAETQVNFMPRTLGRMMLRPGTEYIGATRNNTEAVGIPFIYANDDAAILDMSSDGFFRVWIDDALVSRVSVSTAVANGAFSTDIANWTDNSETGATAAWETGGYAALTGTGFNAAILDQQVSVAGGDQNKEHGIRITVERGPVLVRIGSSSGGGEYVSETALGTGTHSLAVTPTGDIYIRLLNFDDYKVLVDSVQVESSGTLELPTPWNTSALIDTLRWEQSGDVVYLASDGYQQRKIERRATRSWSIVLYETNDGPFLPINTSGITLTASAVRGDITLTASRALFQSTHVGALFRLTSAGQSTDNDLAGASQSGDSIRVTGLQANSGRDFDIEITGTWVGTIALEYSVNEEGSWIERTTYTSNQDITFTGDNDDNVIKYWRLTFKTYTSGTATCVLTYEPGSATGVCRVTAMASDTSASARVVSRLGGTNATIDWYEGLWSDYRGWPTAVALYESRLTWAGKDRVRASVIDAYESYDDEVEGDSGPVERSIGRGPVDKIQWLVPLQKLLMGAGGSEVAIKSNSFDEPLTPTNANLKEISTQGSDAVAAVKVDDGAMFVQRSGLRVYGVEFDLNQAASYRAVDKTALVPEIGGTGGIVRMAVQRQPDTRVHCVRADGQVAVYVLDDIEDVRCWVRVQSDGASGVVEDVVVLPGDVEDDVYYLVKRTVNSGTVRYWEKWAKEADCQGGTVNKQADCFLEFSSNGSATITGLSHLEGETVVVWADGVDQGTATVSSGSITLSSSVDDGVVGLAYTAQYKSRKLVEAVTEGFSPLGQKKRIGMIGLVLRNTHYQGIQYGRDFSNLDNLPLVKGGAVIADDTIHATYEEPLSTFSGISDADARVCLQAAAPRPCTVLGLTIQVQENDKG